MRYRYKLDTIWTNTATTYKYCDDRCLVYKNENNNYPGSQPNLSLHCLNLFASVLFGLVLIVFIIDKSIDEIPPQLKVSLLNYLFYLCGPNPCFNCVNKYNRTYKKLKPVNVLAMICVSTKLTDYCFALNMSKSKIQNAQKVAKLVTHTPDIFTRKLLC